MRERVHLDAGGILDRLRQRACKKLFGEQHVDIGCRDLIDRIGQLARRRLDPVPRLDHGGHLQTEFLHQITVGPVHRCTTKRRYIQIDEFGHEFSL